MKYNRESEINLDKIKGRTVKSLALSIVGAVVLLALLTWATVSIFALGEQKVDKEDIYKAVILIISVYYCIIYLLLSQVIPRSFYAVIYKIDLFFAKIGVFFTGFHIDAADNFHDVWYNIRRGIKLLYSVGMTIALIYVALS